MSQQSRFIGAAPTMAIPLNFLVGWPANAAGFLLNDGSGNLSWQPGGGGAPVSSVFGRAGAVVAVAGDYDAAKIFAGVFPAGTFTFTDPLRLQSSTPFSGGLQDLLMLGSPSYSGTVGDEIGIAFGRPDTGLFRARLSAIVDPAGQVSLRFYGQSGGVLAAKWQMQGNGHLYPLASGVYDLGTAALLLRTIYTTDIQTNRFQAGATISGRATIADLNTQVVVTPGATMNAATTRILITPIGTSTQTLMWVDSIAATTFKVNRTGSTGARDFFYFIFNN